MPLRPLSPVATVIANASTAEQRQSGAACLQRAPKGALKRIRVRLTGFVLMEYQLTRYAVGAWCQTVCARTLTIGLGTLIRDRASFLETKAVLHFRAVEARWQSGYAAACKAAYTGSIPVLASITRWRYVRSSRTVLFCPFTEI